MGDREELLALADELYGGSPEDFTEARNAAAKGADKALAAQIKTLKKPSVAAWAVNLLVRVESAQIDSVLALAESLRAAAQALDGDELRALTRQRRQLTSALATSARSHARDAGVRLTGPVVDQVEGMLTAAMLDPVAAQVVRTGRVLTAFTATGVSELDVATVVALADDLDVQAVAREAVADEPGPPELTVVEGGRAKVAAAEEALEAAREQLAATQAQEREAGEVVSTLSARRLQLQGEADELRRRLAAIDDEVDEVDEELEEAEEDHEQAAAELRAAQETEAAAAATLDELT